MSVEYAEMKSAVATWRIESHSPSVVVIVGNIVREVLILYGTDQHLEVTNNSSAIKLTTFSSSETVKFTATSYFLLRTGVPKVFVSQTQLNLNT